MKKTLTVNLGGTVFHIDEDAYRLLDNYLSNLKIHFRKEAGADEIIDDIERRISELFTEKLAAGSQVITIAYVEEVIDDGYKNSKQMLYGSKNGLSYRGAVVQSVNQSGIGLGGLRFLHGVILF